MTRIENSTSLNYIRKLYARQDALLARAAAACDDLNMPIQIAPEEGKLLQMFITLYGVKTIVEVGTLAGYSALWMARALPEDGHLYTMNKDKAHVDIAQPIFDASEVRERITMIQGDAHDTLPTLNDKGPFDMVFIDADKLSYNDYLDWAEEHVRRFGLIIADNTLFFGTIGDASPPPEHAPSTWHAMKLFNERLADDSKYFSTLIPTQQGLTIAVKLF